MDTRFRTRFRTSVRTRLDTSFRAKSTGWRASVDFAICRVFNGHYKLLKSEGTSMSGHWMMVLGVVKSNLQSRTGFKKSSDREAIWEVRSTSDGREATVTERAARFNPDPFSYAKRLSRMR